MSVHDTTIWTQVSLSLKVTALVHLSLVACFKPRNLKVVYYIGVDGQTKMHFFFGHLHPPCIVPFSPGGLSSFSACYLGMRWRLKPEAFL